MSKFYIVSWVSLLPIFKILKSIKCIFRCWSLKFKQSDHQFLHQSNVFHHINNILSKSDDGDSEESFSISVQSGFEVMNQASITALASEAEIICEQSVLPMI